MPSAVVSTPGCVSDTPGEKETMLSLPKDSGLLGMAKERESWTSMPGMISDASGPWETLP